MAGNTPNLDLYKKDPLTDGNDYFDIDTMLNENWDKIDNAVGGQVVHSPPTPVTLTAGTQTINVDRDTPFAVLNIQGLTRVNLLGRDGNCEDLKPFGRVNAAIELDSNNKQFGSNSLKVTISATTGYGQRTHVITKNTGMYLFCGYVKNGNLSGGAQIEISDNTYARRSQKVTDTEKFNFVYGTIDSSLFSSSTASFNAMGSGASGEYAYFDGLAVYWIPAETKTDIDSGKITSAQIENEYGYVDSLQNVNAVYINTKAEDARESYLYLPTCQLASNLDGSVADRMYMDNEGKPRVLRQYRRVVLDGSLNWNYNTAPVGGNYKEVRFPLTDNRPNTGYVVKYDGKIINPVNPLNGPDQFNHNNGFFRVTIPNSDSGWGPDYTPTKEEVKAYFYGWKMWRSGEDSKTSQYNGEGTKYWGYWDANGNIVNGTPVLPTTSAYTNSNAAYKPYFLQYQLATAVDEPLEYEGSLMLYEGTNQVEVGTGIVVREKANPQGFNSGNAYIYVINSVFDERVSAGKLDFRADKLLSIYRNNKQDKYWIFESPGKTYGNEQAKIYDYNYDPSAVYQVTYLALDTYKIGISPTEISAEYAVNLRGTVDSLVEGNKNALSRITVLENETAMKEQPEWIQATLLNGWVQNKGVTETPVGYRKTSDGKRVQLRGIIKDGVVNKGTHLFFLPVDYQPKYNKNAVTWSATVTPNEPVATRIFIGSRLGGDSLPGEVKLQSSGAGNRWLVLDGIEFDLEE